MILIDIKIKPHKTIRKKLGGAGVAGRDCFLKSVCIQQFPSHNWAKILLIQGSASKMIWLVTHQIA